MSQPVNHHYLPVFYLRQWCNADGKVVRYYRPHKDVVASPIAPDNTGYEPFLYTLPGNPPGKEQVIETEFMGPAVDEPASRALKVLIERDREKMTAEMRVAWTRFLMAMRLRDPNSIGEVHALAQRLLKDNLLKNPEEYLRLRLESDPRNAYDWMQMNRPHVLENLGKLFLPGLIDHEKIGDRIINMHWSTFDLSASSVTLLAGDRPFITTHGLADPQCVLAFPLAPRSLFIATNHPQRQRQLLEHGTTRIVKAANANIVGAAIKHVYGNSATHLWFVEKRLLREPGTPAKWAQ